MPEPVLLVPSRGNLKKYWGGKERLQFLEVPMPALNMKLWDDDFDGDLFRGGAAPGVYQSTASGTSSATAALVTTGADRENGCVLLDAGSDNAGRSDLSLGMHYQANRNCVIAVRLKMSAITSVKVEIGFTDVLSGTDAGALNVKATPTFNATDCAVWSIDTNDNTNWEGVAAATGDTTPATTVEAAISPTADTFEWMIVALREYDSTNNLAAAKYIRADANGGVTFESAWQTATATGAISSNVLLTPWVFVQNRSGTQRTCTIDRLIVWQRRTGS